MHEYIHIINVYMDIHVFSTVMLIIYHNPKQFIKKSLESLYTFYAKSRSRWLKGLGSPSRWVSFHINLSDKGICFFINRSICFSHLQWLLALWAENVCQWFVVVQPVQKSGIWGLWMFGKSWDCWFLQTTGAPWLL